MLFLDTNLISHQIDGWLRKSQKVTRYRFSLVEIMLCQSINLLTVVVYLIGRLFQTFFHHPLGNLFFGLDNLFKGYRKTLNLFKGYRKTPWKFLKPTANSTHDYGKFLESSFVQKILNSSRNSHFSQTRSLWIWRFSEVVLF